MWHRHRRNPRQTEAPTRFVQFVQPSREDALIFKRLNRETRRFHPNSVGAELLARLRGEPWTEAKERELAQEFQDRYGGTWVLQQRNQPGNDDGGHNVDDLAFAALPGEFDVHVCLGQKAGELLFVQVRRDRERLPDPGLCAVVRSRSDHPRGARGLRPRELVFPLGERVLTDRLPSSTRSPES